jgi:DNA-binding transcriptional ArsR family regulator
MGDPGGTLPPSPTIDRCMTDVLAPYALLAGMKLDVFTPLADRPSSAEQLAERLGVQPDRLRQLLFALAAMGLLRAGSDGTFANAAEADHSHVPFQQLGARVFVSRSVRKHSIRSMIAHGRGRQLKTTVDQTLMRGLATAGPCSVSGLPRSSSERR